MGDIAEMMLDGTLNQDGEYTGRTTGFPSMPYAGKLSRLDKRFGKTNNNKLYGIYNFVQQFEWVKGAGDADYLIKQFCDVYKYEHNNLDGAVKQVQAHWADFVRFVKKKDKLTKN